MATNLEYKCLACGGALAFDSKLQKLRCPYCESVYDVSQMEGRDTVLNEMPDAADLPRDEFSWETEGENWQEGETEHLSVFSCKSCGGEIVGDENMAATECPYCGNPVVITGRFQGKLKPSCVIPFKLDREAAKEQYRRHISGKFLLPKAFRQENHIDEIKGIYVPYWLFDSDVNAFARFDAELIRTWSDSEYHYTEVNSFDVFRSGTMSFRHIPVDGSSKMPDDLMESIEPFDYSAAVPFQTAYLAGYFADKYDVDDKQSQRRANERLRQSTIDIFRSTVHGYHNVSFFDDTQFRRKRQGMEDTGNYTDPFAALNGRNNAVSMRKGSVQYALYPVYLLTTTYRGEKYTFAMNGQTGKFVGDLPTDKVKQRETFAAVFAGATALCTFLAYLFMR